VPEVKGFAEARIEEAMGGGVKISMGNVDGGLLHPIVLNDIKIKNKKGVAILPSLEINSIKTSYRVWDIVRGILLARDKDKKTVSWLIAGLSNLDLNFTTADKKVSGFVKITNASGEQVVKGYLNLPSGRRYDFSGRAKDGIYNIEIKPDRGLIRIEGAVSRDGSLTACFKVYHLDLGGNDFVCEGVFKGEIGTSGVEVKKPLVEGVIETRNSLLNDKPFLNLKVSYRIEDSNLYISDLSLSDIIKGAGMLQLREPFGVNGFLSVNNLSLSWLALALGAKDASAVSGTLNTRCTFKGPMAKVHSDIHMEARKGTIATLTFESLNAHLKGEGPMITIEDSRIIRDSGYFVLAGEIDLRKIGKASMFESIRLVGDDKAINWDGWDTSKVLNIRETTMKKAINDDISLDFKKFVTEDIIDESIKYGDEIQLEYKLHPNDSLTVMVGQDKDFVGIEHKNKF